ncbi:LysR family transcriptional regulator [Corticicoccus populi]|uniref:LysR family transcriptional regulator n=1 Tax=Corticicoccus populi TaxID=1812821 RepID=A0ABW5WXF6_9STAP
MNFDQLNYVKGIIETGSMTHAAEKIHISQSALSQSIVSLEKELGHRLFQRSRSGTIPTENGRKLIPVILEILEAERKLRDTATTLSATLKGTLTVATTPSLFMTLIPQALARFKEDYPQIEVQMIERENDEIIAAASRREADIGLCSLHANEEAAAEFSVYPLFLSTRFKAIVPKDSRLAFHDTVTLYDIQQYPFILFDREFYNLQIEHFEAENGPLNILFNTKNPSVLFRSVSNGTGVSIVSDLMLYNDPYLQNESITAISMGYPFNTDIHFDAIADKNPLKRELIETFITYLRNAKDQL